MNCQETQRLVMPYIQDELTPEELEGFLEHVEACPDCREELEIYFTVALGLRQLDEGSGSYNIKGEMEASHGQTGIDRWTQYTEPRFLWSAGSDEFRRAPYQRGLWFFKYYV